MRERFFIISIFSVLFFCGCKERPAKAAERVERVKIETPKFVADSAYRYTEEQLAFGYRIPNTEAHRKTAIFLAEELKRHGADTIIQRGKVTAYNGESPNIFNVIGSFAPEKQRRVLLFAHWDSRPYADYDPNKANHRKPIAGADDGAASVGILLEIARLIGAQPSNVGVDIILFDAEDYGKPYFFEGNSVVDDDWALGSQYWAKHPHIPGYRADFGILLDMVSGAGSVFPQEQVSMHFAPHIVKKVWNEAHKLGYGSYFPKNSGGAVTDDHLYINMYGIPCVDIIAYYPNSETGFPPYWHTLKDDMRNIDKNTMSAVGQTVLSVIYNE